MKNNKLKSSLTFSSRNVFKRLSIVNVLSTLVFLAIISLAFHLHNTPKNTIPAELHFSEKSIPGIIGSVVPASCESGLVNPQHDGAYCSCPNGATDWPSCTQTCGWYTNIAISALSIYYSSSDEWNGFLGRKRKHIEVVADGNCGAMPVTHEVNLIIQ